MISAIVLSAIMQSPTNSPQTISTPTSTSNPYVPLPAPSPVTPPPVRPSAPPVARVFPALPSPAPSPFSQASQNHWTVTSLTSVASPKPVTTIQPKHHVTQSHSKSWLVGPGDTLSEIASVYGVSVHSLAHHNNIINPNLIYVGQIIHIP